jgi:ribosomal protein S18 acetylase RimI-like enzyme
MVTIRPYTPSDYDGVKRILVEAGLYEEPHDTRERLEHLSREDPQTLLVATDGEEIIGTVYAMYHPWTSFIWHLGVKEDRRGQGLGGILMRHAEDVLRSRGAQEISIFVDGNAERLQNFYEQQGWDNWRYPYFPMGKRL